MFVELHIIQSFAPSNLNRDDTNNPKECEFGGVRRARISSQCIKRTMHTHPVFEQTTRVPIGTRTRWLMAPLRERLLKAGHSVEEVRAILPRLVTEYASKLHEDVGRTVVVLYISESEMASIVDALRAEWPALLDETTQDETMSAVVKELTKAHKEVTSAPISPSLGECLPRIPRSTWTQPAKWLTPSPLIG